MTVELLAEQDGPLVMNAAGTVKSPDQIRSLLTAPLSAIVAGSYTLDERPGNDGRTFFDGSNGALNSMGLPGPDLSVWSSWVREVAPAARDNGKQLWVSVAGFNPPEYRILTEAALEAGADAVEANLGCPNVWHDGEQKPIVSYSAEQTALVLDELRELAADGRVGVKLSPILDSTVLAEVDASLASTRVAFVTAINTVPNCYALDEAGLPAISFGKGLAGMSGPAVKWIGLGQIIAHRQLLPDIPLIGVGGISTGTDLADYLSEKVGARACQVATAFWLRGTRVFGEILQEYADTIDA